MAAIENLEIVVDVDISDALADLQALQEELEAVAREIRSLRREGRRGFTVQSDVESIADDLTRLEYQIKAFERMNEINIGANVDGIGGGAISRGGGGGGAATRTTKSPLAALAGIRDSDGLMDGIKNLRGAFSQMAEESSLTNINMADMHNVLARLVPLILVFIGAIPAAVAAIYSLAAAAATAAASFAAIAGFGALGLAMEDGQLNMQNLSDAFNEVRDDFLDAFAPLANRLQPLFEDALGGLETLFNAIADEGDALVALTDEARAFGGFILNFLPMALRSLAAFADSMSSAFSGIGDFLRENFGAVLRELVKVTMEALPAVSQLALVIGRALPAIIEMSAGFAQVLTYVIQFIGAMASVVGLLGLGNRAIGFVVASLLSLISVVALGSTIIGSVFVSSIISAIGSLYTFILSAHGASGALGVLGSTMLGTALSAVVNFVAGLITSIGALFGFTIATYQAAAAAAALVTILTLGAGLAIVGLATTAAGAFTSMAGSIDSATQSLKEFDKVQSGVSGSGFGGSGDNPYGYDPNNPDNDPTGGSGMGVTVFNVESSGDPDEDRSNLEHADWLSGRTTGGG